MVQVKGTKGNIVQVEIFGINEVIRQLQASKQAIFNGADMGVVRAGTFIQEEVKESIIGNRAETKSVDTGLFGNSIEFKKTGEAQGIVQPRKDRYPKSKSNTQDVALILEKGTTTRTARRHFGNTKTRNEKKIKEIIDNQIKTDLKYKKTRIF